MNIFRKFMIIALAASAALAQREQEPEVRKVIAAFLDALTKQNLPALRSCWADHPVVFLPVLGA